MAISMPKILDCMVMDCSYNKNKECHAMAITVGSGGHPMCDTFVKLSQKGGVMDMMGGVGACREAGCKFNQALECSASGIHVGRHADHADCSTFTSR
jgi:uncharacterized protein DUF1540